MDCKNGYDELFCPGRFYCSNTTEDMAWINEDRVCDGVRDCKNGKDECTGCKLGALGNSEFMIRNNLLAGLAMVGGLAIMLLNMRIGYKTFKESPESKCIKVDRIFRMQIAFYDLIMGLYLVMLVLVAFALRLKDDYCQLDEQWRSSKLCPVLGCIFSVSTHGSFLLITAMSFVRFLNCLDLVEDISMRVVWTGTLVAGIFNLGHALAPAIPLWQVQEFFRTSIILNSKLDNPFITQFNQTHMARMHSLVYNSTPGEQGIETVLDDLRNITSEPYIFDYVDIGYYGNSPLCVANVFKNQASYLSYKVGYCVTVIVLIALLAVFYISIVVASYKTSAEAGAAAASSDNVKKLALKVSLLIGSQLVAWISYVLTLIYYTWINPTAPSAIVQEVFSLVVLPSNSLLNPIFYSSIYRKVADFVTKCLRKLETREETASNTAYSLEGRTRPSAGPGYSGEGPKEVAVGTGRY